MLVRKECGYFWMSEGLKVGKEPCHRWMSMTLGGYVKNYVFISVHLFVDRY